MKSRTGLWFLTAAAVAGWFAWQRYEIRGLDQLQLTRRGSSAAPGVAGTPPARHQETLRIASFHIQDLGAEKMDRLELMEVIVRTIQQFDVVAIQGLHASCPKTVQLLQQRLNADGRHYALVTGGEPGLASDADQYGFLFDQATVEVDRGATYTVEDPDELLCRPPLVAWFRARGPAADQAFTFTLVNVCAALEEPVAGGRSEELQVLGDVFFSVRDDGRGEDDVILLGDFHRDDQHLGALGRISGMLAAIAGVPTDTRGTRQLDNLLFQLPATREYVGRSGVFDYLRAFNLTLEQALAISDHLPVWAEFSVYEGGAPPASTLANARTGR